MTTKTVSVLIAVVAGLVLALLVLDRTERNELSLASRPLLEGFEARANDVDNLQITRADGAEGAEGVTIRRNGDAWTVTSKDDYPADFGKLRQLIIALADARIVEEKTSNPEQYERLGVADPDAGGNGTKVLAGGQDFAFEVIVGNSAQGDFCYARVPNQATSYLIDKKPDIPQSSSDWLLPDILDVSAERIRSVSIAHADGEKIVIEKAAKDDADYSVVDVPQGRELSYASVGNGIAGALAKLELEDVRARRDGATETTVVYTTWDGLQITAAVSTDEDTDWVAFAVAAADPAPEAEEASPDVTVAGAQSEALALDTHLSPWQYRLPDYKKNLLQRRWDDILEAADSD